MWHVNFAYIDKCLGNNFVNKKNCKIFRRAEKFMYDQKM
jgi:hypothetical protein